MLAKLRSLITGGKNSKRECKVAKPCFTPQRGRFELLEERRMLSADGLVHTLIHPQPANLDFYGADVDTSFLGRTIVGSPGDNVVASGQSYAKGMSHPLLKRGLALGPT